MRKVILLLASLFLLNLLNVNACGELKSISVTNATVKALSETSYLVRLNSNVDEIMLNVESDYDFVDGYGSRLVSTKEDAVVKIDGFKCGYGIYSYTIQFEVSSKAIAENTIHDDNSNLEENVEEEESETPKKGLKNIEIEGYPIDFNTNTYKYTIEVPVTVNSINITPIKYNETDSVTISDKANNLGAENTNIMIIVSSEESITYYQINVVRVQPKSENNYLASLSILGYPINFDSNVTEYSLNIPNNVSFLNITAEPQDENAQININGNNYLIDGSIITITITAENGTPRDYIIRITKTFNMMDLINEYKIYIIISLLIILLILLILISKKKGKGKKTTGPSAIDTPITTAGEIKAPALPVEEVPTEKPVLEKVELKIIAPTDVENNPTDEHLDNTITEVFKL